MQNYFKFPMLDFGKLVRPFVLLETNNLNPENYRSYLFLNPHQLITAYSFSEIDASFEQVENVSNRFFIAGYIAYEVGYYWQNIKLDLTKQDSPLVWLGVFKKENVHIFNHQLNSFNHLPDEFLAHKPVNEKFSVTEPEIKISRSDYFEKIGSIKKYIEAGDTYQVNFTTEIEFNFSGSPFEFYRNLKSKQTVSYNALIALNDTSVISISPELYFGKDGRNIITRPMKGTMPRGRFSEEDLQIAGTLQNDIKNRSENIMIVDLMRNDLGRISEIGSVVVDKQFEVEKYNTLFQMTTTVKSRLKDEVGYADIFKNLFPSGSVTGAPKIRTMEIIKELEQKPRGVYTGAIGFISPDGDAAFNVPIRTITLENGVGRMGIGSGIVYDSDAQAEYDECLLKANFLVEEFCEFSLIETMLWDGGIALLDLHLKRLQNSAEYFGFEYDRHHIEQNVTKLESGLRSANKIKVRLLLNHEGEVSLSPQELNLEFLEQPVIMISQKRVSSRNRFLFHKTTHRDFYNDEYTACKKTGFFDVIFMNENDEITEGAISNIFIKKNNTFYTPPVECGLLNGVQRQNFLSNNQNAVEKKISINELYDADEIYLTNAVRGITRVWLNEKGTTNCTN